MSTEGRPSVVEVVMPQMGESLAEGTVVRWLKEPGQEVARDEPLFEITTDKVDSEVPSPVGGRLQAIVVPAGKTVAVGAVVALVESVDASPRPAAGPSPGGAPSEGGHFKTDHGPQIVSFDRAPAPPAASSVGSPPLSPAVLSRARQAGLPLPAILGVAGSGRGGRITRKDLDRHLASAATATEPAIAGPSTIPPEYLYRPQPDDEIVPLSPGRRQIARHMSWSARISPHATVFGECDMSRPTALLATKAEAFQRAVGAPLTLTAIVARVLARALRDFRSLNASVVGDDLVLKPRIHLGVAVALPDAEELVVPVIQGADERTLPGLARALFDLATRARSRRLEPADVQGGTFTLTNPGVFGGLTGTPLIHQPQVAILGLGAVTRRAVVVDDAIAIRPVMTMSLTFDHRAADGMVAIRFLERLRLDLEALPDETEVS